MTKKTFSLAFIGGAPSSAAGYAHFVAARMDGCWDLQAGVFSRDSDENQRAGQVYGVDAARVYSSLEELLAHETGRLDAIAILTPTPQHPEMAMACLRAGVPVICEKALAVTSADAAQIRALCDARKGFLATVYNYSGYPMVRELRRFVRDGVLGEILHFQAEMPQEGYLRLDGRGNKPKVQQWRLHDGPIPTLYLDLAVHLHELIHYLTGLTPLEVISDQSSRGFFDVIDNVHCLCRYSSRVQGHFWFSKCSLGHRNGLRLRIYGTNASAEWYQLTPEELLLSYNDGRRQIFDRASNAKVASEQRYNRFKAGHPAGFNEALANLYVDIHHALGQYKATCSYRSDEIFGAALAHEGLRVFEAMLRSCTTAKWEPISVDGGIGIDPHRIHN